MTTEYCTLFDANYLPRALVLHRSLRRFASDARIHAFCMDEASAGLLEALSLPGVTIVRLAELERFDPALAAIKHTRSPVEYCWTATPAACLYTLAACPEAELVTYLDADLEFFADPEPLFTELSDASILIVPHRYAPRHEAGADVNGVFNVGLLSFRRDARGLEALEWWHERCLEWCYAVPSEGRFGDQKYLDDWPTRFAGIHVLEHIGGGVGPWNAERYRLEARDGRLTVDGVPVVFYHFHSLALVEPTPAAAKLSHVDRRIARTDEGTTLTWWAGYPIGAAQRELLWAPYVAELARAYTRVRALEPALTGGIRRLTVGGLVRRWVGGARQGAARRANVWRDRRGAGHRGRS